jgi:pimeloyl-ACP methyl ester carboxylesterase
MSTLPVLLAAAGSVPILWALHYAFWSWRLHVPPNEDELLRARTRDGWDLAIGRCRPRGPARALPVLLVHGIAMNRQSFEFGVPPYALAAHLAAAGFDCFSLDLRGHGGSRRRARGSSPRWNLDTYLTEDLPAAFEAVRAATGAARLLYVGHSQGALLGLAAAAIHGERVAGLVALAAPVHFDVQERVKQLVRWKYPLRGAFTRPIARTLAPFSGYWHPRPAELAINLRNVERRVYRRLMANVIENMNPGVLGQFEAFVGEDSFRSMDGRVDYRALLETCRQPALFVAAERDGIAPPAVVQAAYRRWGGPKRYVVFERDYGHTDLLLGRRAPEVVYPVVRDFLLRVIGDEPVDERDPAPERGGRVEVRS